EMCHVEVGLDLDEGAGGDALAEGSHGPRWQAAIARLGRLGEEDLQKMAEVRADEERLLTRIVAEMAQLDPRLDFSSAVEALSKKFARSRSRRWSVRAADLMRHPRLIDAWRARTSGPDGSESARRRGGRSPRRAPR